MNRQKIHHSSNVQMTNLNLNNNVLDGQNISKTNDVDCQDLLRNLQSLVSETTVLHEPDYEKMQHDRMQRNMQAMSTITPSRRKCVNNVNIEKSQQDKAAISIQKHFRGFLGRKFYLNLLQQQFEKEEAARRLTQMEQVEEGQLLVENHRLEVAISDELVALRNRDRRIQYYATVIQRAWRRFQLRQKLLLNELHLDGLSVGGKEYLI